MARVKEQWLKIDGCQLDYWVSDAGRIRNNKKILTPVKNSKGYYRIQLLTSHGKKALFVHRLVAAYFCEKPTGCDIVNHLNFNPTDNRKENLEWTTHKGNMRHSINHGRFDRTEEWIRHLNEGLKPMRQPVIGTSCNTGNTIWYEGVNKVAKDGFQPSCVSNCCNGKRFIHKGFKWRFDNVTQDCGWD